MDLFISRNERGFTMVEVLIVVAVIGIILAIALPNISAVKQRSRDEEAVAKLGVLEQALQQYKAVCKTFPMGTSDAKVNLSAKNGLNGSDCPGSATLSSFLPPSYTLPADTQYVALQSSKVTKGDRCTSYRLQIALKPDSVPVKRRLSRDWKWSDVSSNYRVCGGSAIAIPSVQTNTYDVVSPAPY